jgi:hypothetical protein
MERKPFREDDVLIGLKRAMRGKRGKDRLHYYRGDLAGA